MGLHNRKITCVHLSGREPFDQSYIVDVRRRIEVEQERTSLGLVYSRKMRIRPRPRNPMRVRISKTPVEDALLEIRNLV